MALRARVFVIKEGRAHNYENLPATTWTLFICTTQNLKSTTIMINKGGIRRVGMLRV